MHIQSINIRDLRIFQDAQLSPGPGINLVTGDNGSGKTTLLEAIYLLGWAKSFRHRESGPFIRKGEKHCQILVSNETSLGQLSRLGIERGFRHVRVRKDGEDLHKRSDLLKALPIHLLTPHTHELLEKSPDIRRRFLDIGLFHVEHDYHALLSSYARTLKQRNAALRQQPSVATSFNDHLARFGSRINAARRKYVDEYFSEELTRVLVQLTGDFQVTVNYQAGWESEDDLRKILKEKLQTDIKRGYTTIGPHRADLVIQVDSEAAVKKLSRGQQKMLVYAMKIAQCKLEIAQGREPPIFLVDDVAAELDEKNLNSVMGVIDSLNTQAFVTAVNTDRIRIKPGWKMFHVEQGGVIESPE